MARVPQAIRHRVLLIPVIAAIAVAAAIGQAAAQRGVPHDPPVFTELPMPGTLRGLWDAVPLVLFGRVQTVGLPRVIATGGSRIIGRIQTVRVAEILKGPVGLQSGTTIKVLQYGGTVEIDGREESSAYREGLLEVSQEVVLFLFPSHEGAWHAAWTRASVLRVDQKSQAATVPPGLAAMAEFGGRKSAPLAEVLAKLRALKKSDAK